MSTPLCKILLVFVLTNTGKSDRTWIKGRMTASWENLLKRVNDKYFF